MESFLQRENFQYDSCHHVFTHRASKATDAGVLPCDVSDTSSTDIDSPIFSVEVKRQVVGMNVRIRVDRPRRTDGRDVLIQYRDLVFRSENYDSAALAICVQPRRHGRYPRVFTMGIGCHGQVIPRVHDALNQIDEVCYSRHASPSVLTLERSCLLPKSR